jgi:hypothetical protein
VQGRTLELGESLTTDNLQPLARWEELLGFELEAAVEHTNAHHREQVMGRVRVIVHAAEESRGRVPADVLREQMATTRVLVEEGRDIMDEATDNDEWASLDLFLDWRRFSSQKGVRKLGMSGSTYSSPS